jgi:hypothetical protein
VAFQTGRNESLVRCARKGSRLSRRGKKRRTTIPDEKAVERIAMMIAVGRILTAMTASGCNVPPSAESPLLERSPA